jgi:isopenicillin-N epimerase
VQVELGKAIRSRFCIPPDIAFLNHGSFGATPRAVLDAQRALIAELEMQPVAFMRGTGERVRRVVARVAPLLRADPSDVVLVDNATTAVSSVLHSIAWQSGDVIVTTDHAYLAVRNALRHFERTRGVVIRVAPVPFPIRDPQDVVAAVEPLLAGARLAMFDHITSVTGLVFPIERLVNLCRSSGVLVFVDAAHALGQIELDVPAIGADWWVTNAHKWLFAPKGCAVLHVRRDRQAETHPAVLSIGTGEGFHAEFDFVGTRDPSAWLALEASVAFVEELGGLAHVRAYQRDLRRRAADLILARLGGSPPAPESMLAALATLPLPDRPVFAGTSHLDARRLSVRIWEQHRIEAMFVPWNARLWLRIAAPVYAHLDEFARLADVLAAL